MAARTAAVLIVDETNCRLVAVKGTWSSVLRAPEITDALRICDCPKVTVHELRQLPSMVTKPVQYGQLPLDGERCLDLDRLMQLKDGRELIAQLSEFDLENVARAQLALGRLSVWRAVLNRWLTLCDQESLDQVEDAASTANGVVRSILGRIRNAVNETERAELNTELQRAMQKESKVEREMREDTKRMHRGPRAIINAALATINALEKSGMSAASLGKLSNRAGRSNAINRTDVVLLGDLLTEGAPQEEDVITFEESPVAICVGVMTNVDENTSDYALDQGLVVGQRDINAVFEPCLISLSVADRVEESDMSPLTRQRMSVCLPIVSLADERNRRAVHQRLCLVFMNGLSMQHVWMIALGSILRTLETRTWAAPGDTPTGRLLSWFAGQIMEHIVIAGGNRLSPHASLPIRQAFVGIYQTDVLAVHCSLIEAAAILRLLHRFQAPAPISDKALRGAMLARIATGIVQSHRGWLQANSAAPWDDQGPTSLAALTSAVYDTRVTETGAHVPIAGTGRLVDRLDLVLNPVDFRAVVAFAGGLHISVEDLITPGLTLVVLAILDRLSNPHVSSTQAVNIVRDEPLVAAEMSAITAGTATVDDARAALDLRLAWARVPLTPMSPFTTPYGPSALWFYTPSGTIIDMTQGFRVRTEEEQTVDGEMIERLAEHVRAVRGSLMQRYYATGPTGSFIAGTLVVPLQRALVDEHAFGPDPVNQLLDDDQRAKFIQRAVQRAVGRNGESKGNVHSEVLEREAVMLLPSLIDVVNKFLPDLDARVEPCGGNIPLIRRLELELGDRSLDALGSPPSPIWLPRDDPELLDTLDRVQKERTVARIAAMRRRRQNNTIPPTAPPVRVANPVPLNLNQAGRRMTRYLRHEAVTKPNGFVLVDDVIAAIQQSHPGAATVTVDDILKIVESDPKNRFDIIEEDEGGVWVRANQGHSVLTVDPDQLMTPIESPNDLPVCVHGTYHAALANIFRSGALDRMGRHAIQMAIGLPGDPSVSSGVRKNVEVLIYIDVQRAMNVHGLKFYRSANNVICSAGPIPLDCFLKVVNMSDGSLVDVPIAGQ